MDLILIEGDPQVAVRLERALQRAGGGVLRIAESHVDTGAFCPNRNGVSAALVGFDVPSLLKARVLARLWALDGYPRCYAVTTAASEGERLLESIFGEGLSEQDSGLLDPGFDVPHRAELSRLRFRNLYALPLERVVALQRVLVGQA
jgi:hypothetical protein